MERLPTFRRKTKVIREIAVRAIQNFNILPNSDGYSGDNFRNRIPFEDDVEVMPQLSDDPLFWHDTKWNGRDYFHNND